MGQRLPPLLKKCSSRQLVMWAAASRDFYPIHYDPACAQEHGLSGVIVPGALKAAFFGQLLHDWLGVAGQIRHFSASYQKMDYPGQEIRCLGRVTKKYRQEDDCLLELYLWIESGEQKTTVGRALVLLPSRQV
ncbi:MAG: hypothetical protein KF760_18870 [Candidatus Eremiobacteraeota bacterium]|nr:hypothetical protein [Candidatus Eremiobacteraeota bacterium]MCW5868462.1 hypothetical protein [Candidatus Eremiobacteraeota bacterium]